MFPCSADQKATASGEAKPFGFIDNSFEVSATEADTPNHDLTELRDVLRSLKNKVTKCGLDGTFTSSKNQGPCLTAALLYKALNTTVAFIDYSPIETFSYIQYFYVKQDSCMRSLLY